MQTRCVQIANTVFHSCHQCDNIDRLNKYKQQITNNLQLYSCARSQHAHAIRVNWLNIITTFKIIILVERGYELHLDDNFSKMLGFSYKILKKDLQRSDLIPQINRINYLKIYSHIIDNENNPYYLSNVFIKLNVSELTVYNENNKYKKQ